VNEQTTMRRFYLSPTDCQADTLRLCGAEGHHALRVLRVRVGERVLVLNGVGEELFCQVEATGRREVTLRVLQRQRSPMMPHQITLVQAVPKGRMMDFIVQKATELGASRVVPVLCERSVPDWDSGESEVKRARWQAAAVESIKQCGSTWLPVVERPQDLKTLTAEAELAELNLVASLQTGASHLRERMEHFLARQGRLPRSLAVWVGPEGDFTLDELNLIQDAGAAPITLGRLVLRSETAALCCLATLQYELQAPRPVQKEK
jgi:16S rRNA (uracil1498-N3)-methyltransferase